ncbi:MAG: homing endonuclease associated repeat-containing protein [bacterium]
MDPAIHNSNTLQFRGRPLGLSSGGTGYELDEALAAVTRFVEERGVLPTSASWTAAGMRPSEKTIRRKFGSFRAALAAAALV